MDALPMAFVAAVMIGLAGLLPGAHAQVPTLLTDKIYQGSGTINLLKDISAANLQAYLQQNGGALFGVDLNENLAGNETGSSIGVAIKSIELVITTTTGTMTFRDFYTSTSAMIRESGTSASQEFYTLFGTSGSASINGGTTDFDPSALEDVVAIRSISFTGTLLSAQLNVTFLRTANTGSQGNETFFDWSGGPEDFALINTTTAQAIEANAAGIQAAPTSVSYTSGDSAATVISRAAPTAPGAPCPPMAVLAMLGALIAWRWRNHA
jgi:hypothetical protein